MSTLLGITTLWCKQNAATVQRILSIDLLLFYDLVKFSAFALGKVRLHYLEHTLDRVDHERGGHPVRKVTAKV